MIATGNSAERQDDAQLVLRVAQLADRQAFTLLFEAYAPRIKAYMMKLGAPPALAEDLAQDALAAVWRKATYYDPRKAGVAAWVFTIARNLRIDRLRRERSVLAYDLDPPETPDDAPLADAALSGAEESGRVREAMKALPHEQAEVIALSFFEDKPHSEIASQLALPLGTVKSRLRLAMNRLRGALEDLR